MGFNLKAFAWSMAAAVAVMALNGKLKHDAQGQAGGFRGVENLLIPQAG